MGLIGGEGLKIEKNESPVKPAPVLRQWCFQLMTSHSSVMLQPITVLSHVLFIQGDHVGKFLDAAACDVLMGAGTEQASQVSVFNPSYPAALFFFFKLWPIPSINALHLETCAGPENKLHFLYL